MTGYTYLTAIVANVASFMCGTALTWSSPVLPKLNVTDSGNPLGNAISSEEGSWIGSLLALGGVFGPFIFGFFVDKVGRKWTLLSLGVPFMVSYLILAVSEIIELYYVARFILGLAVGGVFTVIPIYVGEIAEDSNRGALGSLMNLLMTAGLVFSYCVGPYVSIMAFNIILAAIPGIYMGLFFFIAAESPHHHTAKGDHEKATKSIHRLRGASNKNNQAELDDIKKAIEKSADGSFTDLFKTNNSQGSTWPSSTPKTSSKLLEAV